ncbi:hypothetical protein B0T24DRAFT_716609 [Lasiosphaeria ovina]|uniref:Uncharacterized protein n=1 Tax=Lasiosphaeria ovina TaxID=92902 RepID=A0AAE0KLL9_9PEZI|nr:hypothetical protein B0T24DRAFT_716609 [Lasiosphaeria ovina]
MVERGGPVLYRTHDLSGNPPPPPPLIENHGASINQNYPTDSPENRNQLDVQVISGPAETLALLELTAARRAVKKVKDLIGPDRLMELLEEDTAAGLARWHDILDQASAVEQSGASHALAEVDLAATVPGCGSGNGNANFTAGNFIGWSAHSAFSHVEKLWAGHPEHDGISISANADGTMRAEILESHGRDETLTDGSGAVVANLHYSFCDIPAPRSGGHGDDGSSRTCGVEAVLAIWMPSVAPEAVVEGIRRHLTIEYANWLGKAYEDLKSGVFKPV